MKTPLVPLAILAVLLAVALSASADGFTGTVSADAIYLQGDVRASSPALVTHLGGGPHSFQSPPGVTLSGEAITVTFQWVRLVGTAGIGGGGVTRVQDQAGSDKGSYIRNDVLATIESWQASDSELLVVASPDLAPGSGSVSSYLATPTSLGLTPDVVPIHIEPPREEQLGFGTPYGVDVPLGWVRLSDGPGATIEYAGTFDVYLYGATYTLTHRDGFERLQTGLHERSTEPTGTAYEYWLNITVLTVLDGRLTIDPGANSVGSYAEAAELAGAGTVALRGASGHLTDQSDPGSNYALDSQDVNLVGTYELDVSGSPGGVFIAGVSGDFERNLIGFTTALIDGGMNPWWWVGVVGLLVASGAGTVTVLKRRTERRRAVAAVAAPAAAPAPLRLPDEALDEEVPAARHTEPGFTWGDLSEEFGVVRAGEKAGVLIVLVPADRVERFLRAVVARGLMAEDTGDRVHAGEHELAVVALEPSPVMMN